MSIAQNIKKVSIEIEAYACKLLAVSKTYPVESLIEAYEAGQVRFGENKVQELVAKYEALPKEIEWHLIGHLQTNKVKYIAPFVYLIHSVDSMKLLKEINKEALKNNRIIKVLFQLYIANEETKFGLSFEEAKTIFESQEFQLLENICVEGFMGMATNTENSEQVRQEFHSLKLFFETCKLAYVSPKIQLKELSIGMSSDYKIALEEGSTLIRVGSSIFGKRDYV